LLEKDWTIVVFTLFLRVCV